MKRPATELTAGRDLTLRLLDADDAPALHRAIEESRAHLIPFLPFATADPRDLDFRRSWIEACRDAFVGGERFQYGVLRGGEVIGGCGIDPVDERTASIGFWVHAGRVRTGVATAVAAALAAAALRAGWETVRIRHDRANVASGVIAERLGFRRVGEEPHSIDAPGQTGTSVVWIRGRAG